MGTHKNWPEDLDPGSPEALKAAVRLAVNVLLEAPYPADFLNAPQPVRGYLKEYRRWHEEQLRPLRDILLEVVQATGESPPPSPETLH
jgi:hypothetical protein